MDFSWDQAKIRRNTLKHKLSFDVAKLVVDGPNALTRISHRLAVEARDRPAITSLRLLAVLDGLSEYASAR